MLLEPPTVFDPPPPMQVCTHVKLKAPFPYHGGKSKIASVIWNAFGDVDNYVEPFFGSGAVLLNRPHSPNIETVNDIDGMVSNFWRAVAADPELVAHYADWPVNENDLHARHIWLVNQRENISRKLEGDYEWYDAKIAGFWVWGKCAWIADGFCSGEGPWKINSNKELERQTATGQNIKRQLPHVGDAGQGINRKLPHVGDAGQGINRKLPHVGDAGQGINRKLPHVGDAGQGINRKLPHVGDAGQGINRKLPHVGDAGRGINRKLPHVGDAGRGNYISEMFTALASRLREVRVCCGDWSRICTNSVTIRHGLTGVFLDPPYDATLYSSKTYANETNCHAETKKWAIANGNNSMMRIAYCCYSDNEFPANWQLYKWTANGGYGNQSYGTGYNNSKLEMIWLSPHCLGVDSEKIDALYEAEQKITNVKYAEPYTCQCYYWPPCDQFVNSSNYDGYTCKTCGWKNAE